MRMGSGTRVVITGMGVVAPNATGVADFEAALREGRSGIRFIPHLEKYRFGCQVGGIPQNLSAITELARPDGAPDSWTSALIYTLAAATEAWNETWNYGARVPTEFDPDTAVFIGTGAGGAADVVGRCDFVSLLDSGRIAEIDPSLLDRLGFGMGALATARRFQLGGKLGVNSSACSTGTEAIANAYFHIRAGRSRRVVAGGVESGVEQSCAVLWCGFDSMRVLARGFNSRPAEASRPLSASATGFVPAAGAGILVLESLTSAEERGAPILAEVAGAHINSGGQRGGGSMTAPNPEGVIRCVREALRRAELRGSDVDLINGHLTGTMADALEVKNWAEALEVSPSEFPLIQSTKSLIGHTLSAAGAIETVASVLQLRGCFVHPSANCADLLPEIASFAPSIPQRAIDRRYSVVAKASFGFGDVNTCLILKRFEP